MADELFYDPDEDKYYTKEELDNAGFDYDVVGTPTPGPVPIPQPEESAPQEIGPPPIPEDVQQFIGPQEPTDPNAPGWLERAFLTTQLGGENLMSGVLGLSKRGVEALGGETKGIDSWLQGIDDLRQQDQARMGETNTLEDVASGAISFVPSMLSGAGALGMTAQQSSMGYGRTYDRLLNEGAPQDKAREGASWGAAGEAIANLPFFSAMKSSLKPLAKYATSALAGGAGGVVGSASDMAATNIGTGKTFTQEEFGDALLKGAKTGFASGLAFTGVHDVVGALKSRAKAIKDYSEINKFKDIIDQAPDEVPPPDVPEPKPEEIVPPPEPKPEPITKTVDIDATKPGQTFDKPIEQRIATEGTEVVTPPKSKLLELPGKAIKAAAEIPGYLKSRLTGKVIDDRPPVEKFLAADANFLPEAIQETTSGIRKGLTYLTTLASKGDPHAVQARRITEGIHEKQSQVIFDLSETLQPYFDLPDKTVVDRALIAARLAKHNKPGKYISDATYQAMGLDADGIRAVRAVDRAMNQSLDLLEEALLADGRNLSEAIDTPDDPTAESPKVRYENEVREYVKSMRDTGYVPASRFGKHYEVRVESDGVSEDGTPKKIVEYADRFDSVLKAKKAARELSLKYGKEIGVRRVPKVADVAYSEFAPDMAGATEHFNPEKWTDRAAKKYPKGFAKHLVRAQLIPGFETNLHQPIADYVVGLANFVSNKKGAAAYRDLLNSMPIDERAPGYKGQLRKYLETHFEDLRKPNSLSQKAINFTTMYYLAGVTSSAVTNTTQIITNVLPKAMGEYHKNNRGWARSSAKAATTVMEAQGLGLAWLSSKLTKTPQLFTKANPEIAGVLARAERDGIISSKNINDLLSYRKKPGRDPTFKDVSMFAFGAAEKNNHIVGFLTGYKIAKDKGLAGDAAFQYAKDFDTGTNFDQTKYNRPQFGRGTMGRLALQFKQYPGNQLRFLRNHMTAKEWPVMAASIGGMMAIGGVLKGIPFVQDLENIADKFDMGFRKHFREMFKTNRDAKLFMAGLPNEIGVDMSGSAGLGEFVPESDRSIDKAIARLSFGTGYDFLTNKIPKSGLLAMRRGSYGKGLALENLLPRFMRNPAKASRALAMGGLEGVDPDRLPILEDPSLNEAKVMAFGYPPSRLTEDYERNNELYKESKRLREAGGDYNKDIARALANGDKEGALAILEEMIAQGQEDPSLAVEPDISSIMNYLMKKESPETSVIKSVPDRGRGNMIDIIDLYKRR